jgi:hypothetical protein
MTSEYGFDKLTQLIGYLRSKGVLHFKNSEIELTLGPEPLPKPKVDEDARQVLQKIETKTGRDGLTAKQQEDLYGDVLDSDILAEGSKT